MAEDTGEKVEVYYKGVMYYLISSDNGVCKLQDTTKENVQITVEGKAVLTKEEYEYKKNHRVSQHVNWIK